MAVFSCWLANSRKVNDQLSQTGTASAHHGRVLFALWHWKEKLVFIKMENKNKDKLRVFQLRHLVARPNTTTPPLSERPHFDQVVSVSGLTKPSVVRGTSPGLCLPPWFNSELHFLYVLRSVPA